MKVSLAFVHILFFMPANREGVNWMPASPKCFAVIFYDYYVTSQFLQIVKFTNNKL